MTYVIGAYDGQAVGFRGQELSWAFPDILLAASGASEAVEDRTGSASEPTSWAVTLTNFPAGMSIRQGTASTSTGFLSVTVGELSSLSLVWTPTEGQSFFVQDGRQVRPRFWVIGIQIDGRGNWADTQFELGLSIEVSDRRLVGAELPEVQSESERIYGPKRAVPMPWYHPDHLEESLNRRFGKPPRMVVHTLPFVQEDLDRLTEVVGIEPGQAFITGTSPTDASETMNAVVTSVELQIGRGGRGLNFKRVTLIERFAVVVNPDNVAAGAVTLVTAGFSWDAVAGVSYYEVRRSGDATVTRVNPPATMHTFTGLSPDTNYTLEVRGVNEEDARSDWAGVEVMTAAIEAPPNLVAVSITVTSIRLDWDAVPGATSYDVRRSGDATIASIASPATMHTFTGLDFGITYTLEVRAVFSGIGESDWSSIVKATEVDLTPDFGTATVADQSFTLDAAIMNLVLPLAAGGNPPIVYALSPALPPGLAFDAATRTISGTPSALRAEQTYTYTATDVNGDEGTLTFTIEVIRLSVTVSMGAGNYVGAGSIKGWAGGSFGINPVPVLMRHDPTSELYVRQVTFNAGGRLTLDLASNNGRSADLLSAWETGGRLVVAATGLSLDLATPDDLEEPYVWPSGITTAQFNAIAGGALTLTLRIAGDAAPPAPVDEDTLKLAGVELLLAAQTLRI